MNFSGRIDTPQQVLRHPSNDSSAKHHWTFSKAARFPNQKNNTNIASYSLPSGKSNRHSGIGFGDRSKNFDGVNLNHPPPTKYDLSSDFDQKKSKGHNFGLNRENIRFANYLKQMEATPAAYEINESLVKHTRSYSLRPKTAYPSNYFIPSQFEKKKIGSQPWPGKYQTIDLIGSGKDYCSSKHKTRNQRSFRGGDRFSKQKQTPGPLDYTIRTIEPDGIYLLSTMKSSGRRAILNQKRQLQLNGNKQTPGPGQYRKPSDFGHYEKPIQTKRPQTARH